MTRTSEFNGGQEQGTNPLLATAVLVTYNSAEVIPDALTALQQCQAISQIIVVDNASSDRTVELVATGFPQVQLIANPENVGFGPGNNLGLEQVTTDFALVLNPDAVVTDSAVSTLLNVGAAHPNAAIIGPLLQRPEKSKPKVQIGSVWDPLRIVVPRETDLEVNFLSGAAMLMRMSLVNRSGYFDPEIFLFYEDDDICRAARRAGYDLILTSKAKITHLMGQSTVPRTEIVAFKQCHFTWSRLYLEAKEFGRPAASILARKTLRKLIRKQWLARLLRDHGKGQILQARSYAVHCFLDGEMPSKNPVGFLDQIANSRECGPDLLKLEASSNEQRQLSRPA